MIRVRRLGVVLGGRKVLDGIDLTVAAGESVGLVGPNGSGKSTLLRALVGLVPYSGEASVAGFDVAKEGLAAREHIAYVPQRAAFGEARVGEVLSFVARLRRIDRASVKKVLSDVGLSAREAERARTLSGGQQQRLSLALALLTGAEVLLLDEPTASLDFEGQRAFLDMAEKLRALGRTMLVASHRPEEISRLTDRVVHLDEGRLAGEAAVVLPLSMGGCR